MRPRWAVGWWGCHRMAAPITPLPRGRPAVKGRCCGGARPLTAGRHRGPAALPLPGQALAAAQQLPRWQPLPAPLCLLGSARAASAPASDGASRPAAQPHAGAAAAQAAGLCEGSSVPEPGPPPAAAGICEAEPPGRAASTT